MKITYLHHHYHLFEITKFPNDSDQNIDLSKDPSSNGVTEDAKTGLAATVQKLGGLRPGNESRDFWRILSGGPESWLNFSCPASTVLILLYTSA